MKSLQNRPLRERKTGIICFRVPPTVEAQLSEYLAESPGTKSIDRIARKIVLEALEKREKQRSIAGLNVNNLPSHTVLPGEAEDILARLPTGCFAACVTSPPYWKKRDYGHQEQLGREHTIEQYVDRLARVLMEVHRVLKDDGTLWLNIDDTYRYGELAGIPWRLALELQRRGWCWRGEIVWAKTPKPEAVKNRPTRAHEPLLMFSKRRDYFYDYEGVLEPHDNPYTLDCLQKAREAGVNGRPQTNVFKAEERQAKRSQRISRAEMGALMNPAGKNGRDVWTITPARDAATHSAIMPVELADRCIKAATKPGDVVLDPFCGSATTGIAALKLGRRFIGIELVPRFVRLAKEKLEVAERNGR
jgi:DNA modification methylase